MYQVKVAREWAELQLTRDGESRVNVHARQILQRGAELDRAVRSGKPAPVIEMLARRLAVSIDQMVDLAVELRGRGRPQAGPRALEAIRAIERYVERLASQARPAARPSLERLRQFLTVEELRLVR